jgi:predicted nucleotide-binding protein
MARKKEVEDRVAPSISASKGIALLRKQIERADEIANLRYDDPRIGAWKNMTEQVVVSCFGKPHDNVDAVNVAMRTGFYSAYDTGADYQRYHVNQVGRARALLEGFIEQLVVLHQDPEEKVEGVEVSAVGGRHEMPTSRKIFIVHGHADKSKAELALLLTRLGFEPVILHEQPNQGMTLIEKLEKHSEVGYVFVLLTPDDLGLPVPEQGLSAFKVHNMKRRARQNVVFEFGRFIGLLGRSRVCCLHTGNVELPSDVNGLVYIRFKDSINEVQLEIAKELRAAEYKVNI